MKSYEEFMSDYNSDFNKKYDDLKLFYPSTDEVSKMLSHAESFKKELSENPSKNREYTPDLFGDGHYDEPSHLYWFINKIPIGNEVLLSSLLHSYALGSNLKVEYFFEEDLV